MGTVKLVNALSGELFDAIEVDAARSGNHKRAAVRMRTLATQAAPSSMSRAEAHMRAGEQWLLAEEPAEAADEFRAAIALGGQTFADPRIQLARALYSLNGPDDREAEAIIEELAETGRSDPRTCDMVAEVLIEQGDLSGALDWATAGVDACMRAGDRDELPLLLRLRYRLRIDLGLDEDDYDRLLDTRPKNAPKPRPAVP
jgi:predicted Zn-dependent protease